MISRVKGTQDFLNLTLLNFLLTCVRAHATRYQYTEITTPILEPTELFTRSLGQYTDVVSKEMFSVMMRDEHEHVCLRPEATAPIVRAFVENGIQQTPWKVFTFGPMFRYERPQKGRFRQFHQISLEVIGSARVAQDVHLITMLDRLFHELLKINDYALLINYLGCADDRKHYEQALRTFLTPDIISEMCTLCSERVNKNLLRILDCKNEACQKLYKNAPCTTDVLCPACVHEWHNTQNWLSLLSVSFVHQPRLVRGLDYYSKTVFEFVSNALGAQNAFCAGGRYDQLVHQIGGKQDEPAVGAAIGVERLLVMLEQIKDRLPLFQPPALHVVIPLGPAQIPLALMIADQLLAYGLAVEPLLDGDSIKSMMRKANKMGAAYAIILGDEEQQANEATLKNMTTGESVRVAQSALVTVLQR